MQILLAFTVLGNLFIAYKLRDMQNMGTNWVFVLIILGTLGVCTVLNVIGAIISGCSSHTLLILGDSGYVLIQCLVVLMMCTVRQNSLTNYKRLPVWFVTFGSLFQLCMFSLLLYQQIYLTVNPMER